MDKETYDNIFNDVPYGNRNRFGYGPHGVGDPDDESVKPFERFTILPAMQTEIICREYCSGQVTELMACRNKFYYTRFFRCSKEKQARKACVEKYWGTENLEQRAKEEYLNERRIYRLTKLTQKYRKNPDLVPPSRKALFGNVPTYENMKANSKNNDGVFEEIKNVIKYSFGFTGNSNSKAEKMNTEK